jgi:hypothetical protein
MEKTQCIAFTTKGTQCSFKMIHTEKLNEFCKRHIGNVCNHPYGTIHDEYLKHGEKRFILKNILFSVIDNHNLSLDEFIDTIDKNVMEELQKKKKTKSNEKKKFIRK